MTNVITTIFFILLGIYAIKQVFPVIITIAFDNQPPLFWQAVQHKFYSFKAHMSRYIYVYLFLTCLAVVFYVLGLFTLVSLADCTPVLNPDNSLTGQYLCG